MKKFLILSVCLLLSAISYAHDFEVDGIYYNITSSVAPYTVEVTYKGTSFNEYYNEYSGAVSIPTSVTYNNKTYRVTSIGDKAFCFCKTMISIEIPNSITSIGTHAFSSCLGLKKVIVKDIAAWCKISWGNTSESNPLHIAHHLYSDENTEIKNLIIPDGVTTIRYFAFYACSGLTSVDIPNSVTNIELSAFPYCSGLTSVTIGNNVSSIGSGAFRDCKGITSIDIPNSVTSIGDQAFENCTSLTSINIPNSVESIDYNAFNNTMWYDNQPDGLVYAGKVAYKYKGTMPDNTSFAINEGTLSITGYAFENCVGLISIDIPNSVTSIGYNAFSGCSGLLSVTIGNGVTSIGSSAFQDCISLPSITIPNSVTFISSDAFAGCTALTSIDIPSSVTLIGGNAFANTAWYNNQPDGLVYAGKVAYKYKGTMPDNTSITLKEGTLGIAGSAFLDCSGLASITIPNGVTHIGYRALEGCSNLTSIAFPNSVISLGYRIIADCNRLTSIVSYMEKPCETSCFLHHYSTAVLYVPLKCLELYQNTSDWNQFHNIIPFGGDDVEAKKEDQEVVFKNSIPEQMDLTSMVIDDTYYTVNTENGDGFDATNGCLVLNSQTSDADVDAIAGKPISDESVKNIFKGFIIKVPAGNGFVSVAAKTIGASALKVKIGNETAQAFQLTEQGNVEIPYTVAEPSYVYVYAGMGATLAKNMNVTTTNAENSVNIYGYSWKKEESTGISIISSEPISANNVSGIYTLDGRKINGMPTQKGIYIVNGKKVVIK